MKKTHSKISTRILSLLLSLMLLVPMMTAGVITAQASTITIMTPEQFVNINWKNAGYGPGHKYVIGADFTLGDGEYATCALTSGNFVIDFNGHTVQNARQNLTVINVQGANVVLMDSKASDSKPSVRSYGAGAVQVTAGTLTIWSGNYFGLSDGTNNPVGVHCGGSASTCNIYGGNYYGDYVGGSCSNGGKLNIDGGNFRAGYMFAVMNMGGTVKITRANLTSGTTTYGGQFAIGEYAPQTTYDFNNWLASGSWFSPTFQTGYWNMQSQLSATPFFGSTFAVAYNTPTLSVGSNNPRPVYNDILGSNSNGSSNGGNASTPAKTGIKKVTSPKKKQIKVTWNKKKGVNGYAIQLATNSKFTKNKKTVYVKKSKTTSKIIKGLKSKKKYYVRVRTYKNSNGKKIYSKWSKAKMVKVK